MKPTTATTPANLADLIESIQASVLSAIQKRDSVSAIRSAAKALAADPKDLPVNVKLLRVRLQEVSPEALGMTKGRWNNVRSLLNRALQLHTKVMTSRQTVKMTPAWRALAELLPKSQRLKITSLLRAVSARGVTPDTVTLPDLEAFRDEIMDNRLRSNPESTWSGIVWMWNKCAEQIPGWPPLTIPRVDSRIVYTRPYSDFPDSLKADVDAYLKVLSGKVLDDDGPVRALRPITLKMREGQFRAAAAALVATGTPANQIRTIADLARYEPMRDILEHTLTRGTGDHTAGAFNMANALKNAARYWVKVEPDELKKISRMAAKLSPKSKGMTTKNRLRLIPLNDPNEARKFLDLPLQLKRQVMATDRPTVVTAITAQLAVAISILQIIPLRMSNLAKIDIREHLHERGQRVFLQIPPDEVKNGLPYEMEVTKETADLISWYCRDYRDLLSRQPTDALFPGRDGQPKAPSDLGRQISARVKQHLGWPVNPHLFRHIAAKMYLDLRPGEYATVSRILNHKSVQTTMTAYTGAESISAGRHFQSLIADLRAKTAPLQKPRRRVSK